MSSKQIDDAFYTDIVLTDLSLLHEATDLSEALSVLTNQDILYEDKGV